MRNVKWSHNLLKKKEKKLYAFCFYTDLTHLKFSSDNIVYICQCIIYEFMVNHLTFLKKVIFQRYGMAVWKDFCFYCYEKIIFFFNGMTVCLFVCPLM